MTAHERFDGPGVPPDAQPECVRHWRRQLVERVGLVEPAIAELVTGLADYCARHDIDPFTLLATWEQRPDLTVRRRPATPDVPNLAVESFLIHNGVNVFGDIVCVAGRPEDLAAQGRQFAPNPR